MSEYQVDWDWFASPSADRVAALASRVPAWGAGWGLEGHPSGQPVGFKSGAFGSKRDYSRPSFDRRSRSWPKAN